MKNIRQMVTGLLWLSLILANPWGAGFNCTVARDSDDVAKLENEIKAAEGQLKGVRAKIDNLLVEEGKLDPNQKLRLANRTLDLRAAKTQYENALRFIDSQRIAVIGNRTKDEIKQWEQTAEGQVFVNRKQDAKTRYSAAVSEILAEYRKPQSQEQKRLRMELTKLEKERHQWRKYIEERKHKLHEARGELRIRALSKTYHAKVDEEIKLVFWIDGGKPPYTYYYRKPSLSGLSGPWGAKQGKLNEAGRLELRFSSPDEGIHEGTLMVEDSGTLSFAKGAPPTGMNTDYTVVHVFVGPIDDGSFRFVIPKLFFDENSGCWMTGFNEWESLPNKVNGGKPPYRVEATTDDSGLKVMIPFDTTQGIAVVDEFEIDVRPRKPGKYWVEFRATDAAGEQQVQLVLFSYNRKTGNETKNPPPTGGGEETGKGQKPVKPESKPPTSSSAGQPITATSPALAWTPLVGRFHARLWGPPYTNPGVPQAALNDRDDNFFTTLVIDVDATGRISGRADFTLPEEKYKPEDRKRYYSHVEFDLDGRLDLKTGKTTIHLGQGERIHTVKSSSGSLREYRTEFETTLTGWQIQGPKQPELVNSRWIKGLQNSQDSSFVPKSKTLTDGTIGFENNGFAGVRDASGKVPIDHKIKRHVETWIGSEGAKNSDRTESARQYEKNCGNHWFLEILQTADDDDDPSPHELGTIKIEPVTSTTIGVGESVSLRAVGVYADNVFETEDVTNKVTWTAGPGLTQTNAVPANFLAGESSRQESSDQTKSSWVRAEADKVTVTLTDTVKVQIRPAGIQVPVVLGMTAKKAKAALLAAGLKAKFVLGQAAPTSKQKHHVYQTIPPPGSAAEFDKPVQVFVYGNSRKQ